MVRILEVKKLAGRKRMLAAQSDVYRQTLKLQIATAQTTLAHLKTRIASIGVSSFAIKTVADMVGLFAGRAQPEGKTGFISKVLSGIKFFGQIKNFLAGMKSASDPSTDS